MSALKQARSLETRRRLVLEAQRIWRERGYENATVDEICEAAGVAKGTFYFYFRRKEDLLQELSRATATRVHEEWAVRTPPVDETTAELLEEVVGWMARRIGRTPRPLLERVMVEVMARLDVGLAVERRAGYRAIFVEILQRGQGRGEVSRDTTAEEYALTLEIVLAQALLIWARGAEEPLEAMLVRRTRTVLRGALARGD